jgi:hypothetical protein
MVKIMKNIKELITDNDKSTSAAPNEAKVVCNYSDNYYGDQVCTVC